MKEKLIRRAAIKYRRWMLKEKYAAVDTRAIFDKINSIISKSQEIKKWTERFLWGTAQRIQTDGGVVSKSTYGSIATEMIPELGHNLINNAHNVINLIKITTNDTMITPLSLKEAIEEIRIISKEWSDIKFRGGILSVLIKDVCLTDGEGEVKLGSFRIHLDLSDSFGGLTIHSIDKIKSSGGYVHPHIKDSQLCTGDGGEAMKYALCQGRLHDCFIIVEAILRTYGEDPHEGLQEWYDPDREGQFFCEGCERHYDNGDSYYCEHCERERCIECREGDRCNGCGEWNCKECINYCDDCENTFCNNCDNSCYNSCGSSICSNCLNQCNKCDNNYCEKCITRCLYCDDYICKNCISTCHCCEEDCCHSCLKEYCTECGSDICEECTTSCNKCNKLICNDCGDHSCEHCGTPMCESCDERHNCLLMEVN